MLATKMKETELAHFAHPTTVDLMTLCRTEGPCVSIFLPPHRAGSGTRPSVMELLALLPKAEAKLTECGMHQDDIETLLKPVRKLADAPEMNEGHRDGLCIYRSPRELDLFSVRTPVEAGCHVEEHFVVSPVLAHLDYRQSFLLLALAGKHIRLMRYDCGEVERLAIPDGVPESAADFARETGGEDHGKNHHYGVQFGNDQGRTQGGHFRRDFMRALDRGLQPLFRRYGLPLVLAGVEEETAAFAALSDYPELLPEPVQMSPDGGATDLELGHAAARIIKRWSNAAEKQALAEFRHAGPGRRAMEPAEIVKAARAGHVQHLFLTPGAAAHGRGTAGGYVYWQADLLNEAAVHTLLHRGMVWLVEPDRAPEHAPAAAVLRYAGDRTGK